MKSTRTINVHTQAQKRQSLNVFTTSEVNVEEKLHFADMSDNDNKYFAGDNILHGDRRSVNHPWLSMPAEAERRGLDATGGRFTL